MNLNGKEVIAYKVPDGAKDIRSSFSGNIVFYKLKNSDFLEDEYFYKTIIAPSGNWQLLGRANEISPELRKEYGITEEWKNEQGITNEVLIIKK
jgi:hypothetical protein